MIDKMTTLINSQTKKNMKNRKLIAYWVFTALFTFGMLASGTQQVLRTKSMVDLITPLGYPVYFLCILGAWKILGVITVLIPGFKLLKEWAYAGFFFAMTGALVSHLACGVHDIKEVLGPVFQLIFILLSWYFRPADRRIV